jgi:hypothetical protein
MGTLLITIWKREKLRTIAESKKGHLIRIIFGFCSGRPASPRVEEEYQHLPFFLLNSKAMRKKSIKE